MIEFKNSKVQDVCYHGTSSEPFTVLDKSKIQKDPEDGDSGYFGWGFYLTTNREYAEEYGDTVLAFKVNIQNPYDFTDIDADGLVDFIFNDCKNLNLRAKETLRVINQIGRGISDDFEIKNSEELSDSCIKLYNKYRDAEVNISYLKDMKSVLCKLALDINNWLNGLFFYFGRELFHYFTINGYDGVVTPGGEEIVVYETKQLKPVDEVQEDLELDVWEIPDWKAGADEFTQRVINSLKSRPDVSDVYLYVDKLYPLRQNAIWYFDNNIISFKYKDILDVTFYCGGELEIYRDKQDNDPICSTKELEDEGIFTDEQYYNYCRDFGIWDNDLADNTTAYFAFYVEPLKNNNRKECYYSYDEGYDDWYELGEFLPNKDDPLGWFFDEFIPEFEREYPEFFHDEDEKSETVNENQNTEHRIKKHVTKGQVLKDVINTFGTITADKLTDAVYLLPNGDIVDTKGPSEKSQHENVAKYISDKYGIKDMDENQGSKLMLELGSMRITPWIPAIFIPDNPLTDRQENTLFDILLSLSGKVSYENPLMISTQDGSQQIEFTRIDNPEEVINSILGYQIFGILKA